MLTTIGNIYDEDTFSIIYALYNIATPLGLGAKNYETAYLSTDSTSDVEFLPTNWQQSASFEVDFHKGRYVPVTFTIEDDVLYADLEEYYEFYNEEDLIQDLVTNLFDPMYISLKHYRKMKELYESASAQSNNTLSDLGLHRNDNPDIIDGKSVVKQAYDALVADLRENY